MKIYYQVPTVTVISLNLVDIIRTSDSGAGEDEGPFVPADGGEDEGPFVPAFE